MTKHQATSSSDTGASPPSRRAFGAKLAATAASLLGLLAAPYLLAKKRATGGSDEEPKPTKVKTRWGMVIDLDRCSGCGACVVACKEENNVGLDGPDPKWQGRQIEWMALRERTSGRYPEARRQVIPMPCNQCSDAACVKVCPVGATYVNNEGIVAVIWDQCIGCRYCMMACPYSRRYFNWFAPEWPAEMRSMLNPDVATRPGGVVEKCTFCHHRIRAAQIAARIEERDLVDGDVQTACQSICPARAITFGNLADSTSEVSRLSRSPRASRLLEEIGTDPSVYYLSRGGTQ